MNTYNWLSDIPIAFGNEQSAYFEVSFKNGSRKSFYKNTKGLDIETGDQVVVSSVFGEDLGRISLSGDLVEIQMRKKKFSKRDVQSILRHAVEEDFLSWQEAKDLEKETMIRARAIARQMNLKMKISDVDFQSDKKKAIFFYIADNRVDFRELIKVYAKEFNIKVEMRQIGSRQEAGMIGGIGTCGRELCCSTWLTDFKSVGTQAARYQNLSINMSKLSGQCGRLKCCLNYELDTYKEALKYFPKKADVLQTEVGPAFLKKTDILKELMWYAPEKSSTFYPLTVEKVKEVLELNKAGKKINSLVDVAVVIDDGEEKEEYTELVGHITLKGLDKKSKNKKRNRKGGQGNKGGNHPQAKNKDQGKKPRKHNPNYKGSKPKHKKNNDEKKSS
ncbi:MAG: regulatory iron-sulfur-containing complex subunit RicT [Chitinophagales bacterium]